MLGSTGQDGTEEDDVLVGVVESGGGSAVVLAGRTGGDWADGNAGEGTDFAAVKLEASDGSEIWRFQVWVTCRYVNVDNVCMYVFYV